MKKSTSCLRQLIIKLVTILTAMLLGKKSGMLHGRNTKILPMDLELPS